MRSQLSKDDLAALGEQIAEQAVHLDVAMHRCSPIVAASTKPAVGTPKASRPVHTGCRGASAGIPRPRASESASPRRWSRCPRSTLHSPPGRCRIVRTITMSTNVDTRSSIVRMARFASWIHAEIPSSPCRSATARKPSVGPRFAPPMPTSLFPRKLAVAAGAATGSTTAQRSTHCSNFHHRKPPHPSTSARTRTRAMKTRQIPTTTSSQPVDAPTTFCAGPSPSSRPPESILRPRGPRHAGCRRPDGPRRLT
jgi:hypothetical protein